jgi:hypothetical protein
VEDPQIDPFQDSIQHENPAMKILTSFLIEKTYSLKVCWSRNSTVSSLAVISFFFVISSREKFK